MRLTAIKLAGFKSFVDPTSLTFKQQVTGVVGPNGCGKSNIIDAVRWVMGESSAKQLRGESMSDVIFNGSSARKPVSNANVELLFDNSEGRAGGQYAAFSEISVRRQVSRDGNSGYFLNGTRCRRKDITDLFLGTGLGPRSYSIIEQGMISQVVEARPEELRHYLEEAAGISKYRERRRETENRIRHTRENLERLQDLRDEVGKQLNKLQRQAKAAEKYTELQAQNRSLQADCLVAQWRELHGAQGQGNTQEAEIQNRLEAAIASQRHAETGLELLRDQQSRAQEQSNTIQGELYQIGARIAQTEQSIQHQKELRERQQNQLQQLNTQIQQYDQLHSTDQERINDLQKQLQEREPQLARQTEQLSELQEQLNEHEQALEKQQQALQVHDQESGQKTRQAEVMRTRIQNLDEQLERDLQQLKKWDTEQQQLDLTTLNSELEEKEKVAVEHEKRVMEVAGQLQQKRAELEQARAQVHTLQQQLQPLQQQLNGDQGRLQSLQALQQAALGEDDEQVNAWLAQQQLADNARLAEAITADSQWSIAVETVLGRHLQAVLVDQAEGLAARLAEHVEAGELPGLSMLDAAANERGTEGLAHYVEAPSGVLKRLASVRCANNLQEALAMQSDLAADESVITPRGEWLGPGWVRIYRNQGGNESTAGALMRQEAIRELEQSIENQQALQQGIQAQLATARQQVTELDDQLEETRLAHNRAQHQHSTGLAEQSNVKERLRNANKRQAALSDELSNLQERMGSQESGGNQLRADLEEMLSGLASQNEQRQRLVDDLEALKQQRDRTRIALNECNEQRREWAVGVENLRATLTSTQQAVERAAEQTEQARAQQAELEKILAVTGEPGEQQRQDLDALLQQQLQTEAQQKDARIRLDELSSQLQDTDAERQQAVQQADALRGEAEQVKLQNQSLALRADNLVEQLQRLQPDADAGTAINGLAEQLSEDFNLAESNQTLERLQARIMRMEPVNLAAINEYDLELERKTYLDSQNDDLEKALQTLEKAIARIDRTTRTRFKETFEDVKKRMEVLFPRLFGGGHAQLEMTGDDLLTTGVTIMARPPGKRVSSIHLLSGGEKALTAVSFVFAIFGLNPAPFCMLDEVDAPLDDANVGRFSRLVKEMSESVQFIAVTHNKVTMEQADVLVGVTMREAGVSRIVSVDIDAAAELVDG